MLQSFNNIEFIIGNNDLLETCDNGIQPPFSEDRISFLNTVSKKILADKANRRYSDVIAFAFWCRKSNMELQKKRFCGQDTNYRLGKGTIFHIAPSNVAVNYAYSFVTGFITGNSNIVRIPSKYFTQVDIINKAVKEALTEYPQFESSIFFVKYAREIAVNDFLSEKADVRVVWGGDHTIAELRKSPLQARSEEITFADRYSLAVIDAESYINNGNYKSVAQDFYNDTYLTDQNACTSPRIVIWIGDSVEEAQKIFWEHLYEKALKAYSYQDIQGVNKLTTFYMAAACTGLVKAVESKDNLLKRISINELSEKILDYKGDSGLFYEYHTQDIREISVLCTKRCQTVSYIGEKEMLRPLLKSGVKGIDRIVPVGKTMDFDFIWDGYNLFERMTRVITML